MAVARILKLALILDGADVDVSSSGETGFEGEANGQGLAE